MIQKLPAKLAQAVQDKVAAHYGTPPPYQLCLTKVHAELRRWERVPMEQREETWEAVLVSTVVGILKKSIAQLVTAQVEDLTRWNCWVDGYKIISPEGKEQQPYLKKAEALRFCKHHGWIPLKVKKEV